MNILEIAKNLDAVMVCNNVGLKVYRVGALSRVIISIDDDTLFDFKKVNEAYSASHNDVSVIITPRDFENILSPYLGKRTLMSIMV